jgi:hypothetical protein
VALSGLPSTGTWTLNRSPWSKFYGIRNKHYSVSYSFRNLHSP